MDDDRLLELHPSDESAESTFAVTVTPLVERLEIPADSHIDWNIDERDRDPMLVFGRIDEDEIPDAAYPRRLRAADGEVTAPVPDTLLATDPPGGLGVDLDLDPGSDPRSDREDNADGSLLFDAVATDETIGLVPVRFADGTPYGQEPQPDVSSESDPVAEATLDHDDSTADGTPRPETLDAPIDPELLEAVLEERDVALDSVAPVLEGLNRRELVGEADAVGEYPPLGVDDRGVCVIDDDEWDVRLADRLDIDDEDVLEAAREIHNRQAKHLVSAAGATEYRGFDGEYDAVVTDERDTAEWEVAEPGSE